MAKTAPARSGGDTMLKSAAERLNLSKKALKKAVRDATVRLVAEKIARERLDSSWQEIADQARQPSPKPKAESPKGQ